MVVTIKISIGVMKHFLDGTNVPLRTRKTNRINAFLSTAVSHEKVQILDGVQGS